MRPGTGWTPDSVASGRSTRCKQLLIRESQVQPLLVVFEDLHWIDSETQALLDGLVESLPAARLLLLVNYRPEYQHQWGSRTYYTQLRLDPLPPETAEELLGALLGPDAGLEPLKRMLIARTEGNPLFLEESVRALVETGALCGRARGVPAGAAASGHPGPRHGPGRAGRPHRPAGPERQGAPADGVGGREGRAVRAAPGDGRAARGRAARRDRPPPGRRVPVRDGPLPGSRIHLQACPHPRGGLREPAPGAAPRASTREIVEAIERLYPDRLGEHIERLAHHAFRAERWETAVAYLARPGTRPTRARRSGRPWSRTSRRWRRSSTSPRPARRRSRRSTCGWICARPCRRSAGEPPPRA